MKPRKTISLSESRRKELGQVTIKLRLPIAEASLLEKKADETGESRTQIIATLIREHIDVPPR